jgi:peptidylprolyl isomerase
MVFLLSLLLLAATPDDRAAPGDVVKVRYTVRKGDGMLVDEVKAPRVVMLPVDRMLPGWRQAVLEMTVGEKRQVTVPPELGAGKIKEGEVFVIDTELVEILHTPRTPPDVAAAPADATVTKSGLAYKVLREGTGDVRPNRRNKVVVHYTGWTTDGQMIDSSILRGEPATFGMGDVIRGWTEGLQLMRVGEKTRFWIPARLAYGNERGKPRGMLVFDIELVSIER